MWVGAQSCEFLTEEDMREDPDLAALREIVTEFDDLMEECMTMPLNAEDQKRLDELYGVLMHEELEFWHGVSDEMVEMIEGHSEFDFPMIRTALGMLPVLED